MMTLRDYIACFFGEEAGALLETEPAWAGPLFIDVAPEPEQGRAEEGGES